MPSKKVLEVLLVRRSGSTPPAVIEDIDRTVRELLAPFRLGRRLFYDLVLRDGDISVMFQVRHSAQMSLSLAGSTARSEQSDFAKEVHSISEYLRSFMESIYDQACGLQVTPYDLSTALERARARNLLVEFCWRQGECRTERIKLLFADESPEEFQLVPAPGLTFMGEATHLTFEITSVEYSSARIRLVGSLPSGIPLAAARSSVKWDRRASPGVSRFFFEALEHRRSVSAALHGVVKPNGTIGSFHLSAGVARQMLA